MLFFLSTLLPLVLVFATGEHHQHHNQVHHYSRIPEQTITYEQISGSPENRVIEFAPSKNVLHLHFDNGDFFASPKPSSVSTTSHSQSDPVSLAPSSTSGVEGKPSGSFMRRTSYIRPEVYSPVVHQHQQYGLPVYRSQPFSYSPTYSSAPRNAYPLPRTYYVPAQPITHNPNMIRIAPTTYQTVEPRPQPVESSMVQPASPIQPQSYTYHQPNVVRVVNQQWANDPIIQNQVIRVPTIVADSDQKYTLITINSPIHTDIPPYQRVFPSTAATSAGMTGSQNFDRVDVPLTSRSNEPIPEEPFVVRAASFSSKPKTEIRATIYRPAGGIIVHRLEEQNNLSKEPKAVESEVAKPEVKVEIDQPTAALAIPSEGANKVTIEPAKIIASTPIQVDVGPVAVRSASVDKKVEGFNVEKLETTKEDPSEEEILES